MQVTKEDELKIRNVIKHYGSDVYSGKKTTLVHMEKELNVTRDFLFRVVKDRKGMNALDIACQMGRYSFMLADMGIDTVGIDTSVPNLEVAKARLEKDKAENLKFLVMDATKLSFEPMSFDIVLCIELMHHMSNELANKLFEEVLDLAKKGGFVVIDIKNKFNPYLYYVYRRDDSDNLTLKTRSISFYRKIAERHGFKMVFKRGLFTPFTQIEPFIIVAFKRSW